MKSAGERSASGLLAGCLLSLVLVAGPATCEAPPVPGQQQPQAQQPVETDLNFPYYMQSPQSAAQQQHQSEPAVVVQRANIAVLTPAQPAAYERAAPAPAPLLAAAPAPPACLYGHHYFARLHQCLERKPHATVGLPAFKNDDLLAGRHSAAGLGQRHGCSFILTNGLFKNYQLSKYALQDADTKCLDDNKRAHLSMRFSNATLYYLWQLRCLNQANQLLEDGTLDGRSASVELERGARPQAGQQRSSAGEALCVGSSQNFGFAALQLTHLEAQLELALDIYKNWRVTNISLALLPAGAQPKTDEPEHEQLKPAQAALRDFTFESLDGDELNWRYLSLYENWTRNRLHANFLEQFKRFLWISLQRCLGESADKLPVKLVDLFGQQHYSSR